MKEVRDEAGECLSEECSRFPHRIWKVAMKTQQMRNNTGIYMVGTDRRREGLKSAQKHGR